MRSRVLVIGAGVALVFAVASCGSGGSQVVKISTFPWPEGPGPVVAAAKPVLGVYVPLKDIEKAIPKTLPKNPPQTCSIGAKVQITLKNGRVLTYGPCERPASVERLRLALIKASQRR